MYKELVSQFNLKKGDMIWLSSDITRTALLVRSVTGVRFDAVKLIDEFKEAVGETGTILLPTFNYDFSNNGFYDYTKSKGITGALGNIALEKCGFVRTTHPLHSFAVWGKDKDLLVGMNNSHSFGKDSPFGYCHENNVTQVMLGTDWRSFTFVHYAETICNVPYRFPKTFTGIYVDGNGNEQERHYDYAARDLNVGTTECFDRIWEILRSKNIATDLTFKDVIKSHMVRLGDSLPVICDDILHNKCRNIYDFTVDRDTLFKGFGENI